MKKELWVKMKRNIKRKLGSTLSTIKYIFNKIRFSLEIWLIFILILILEPKLPNILEIKNASTAVTLLSVIISALASILGIIIAVILVAFEILRKTYTTYAFKSFFQNEQLNELSTLYVSSIIISVLTITSLSDSLNIRDISLIYFSLFLFITSILILFPYSRKIIASTQSKKTIIELINKIDEQLIATFNYFRPDVPPSTYISRLEDNPIFILSEVAIRSIKDDDRLTPKLILVEATNKLLKMLEANENKRMTINAFLIIYRNTARTAIQVRQESVLRTILDCMERLHLFCAEKKILWHQVIELNKTLVDLLDESIKAGLDEIIKYGFYSIVDILKNHLDKNIPNEDEIRSLHIGTGKDIPADPYKNLQWNHISTEYIGMIANLIETSIELKRSQAVSNGLNRLAHISSTVISSELGDLQKSAIISRSYYLTKTLTLKCIDEGLYKKIFTLSLFNSFTIEDALEEKVNISKDLLIQFSEFLLLLAEKDSLDESILNDLGTLGRCAVEKLGTDHIFKAALLFIIDVFKRLREIVEANLSEEKRLIYLEIYSQIESLKKWMEQYNKKDQEIESNLNDALSKFDQLETLKKKQSEGIIKWPNIKNNSNGSV